MYWKAHHVLCFSKIQIQELNIRSIFLDSYLIRCILHWKSLHHNFILQYTVRLCSLSGQIQNLHVLKRLIDSIEFYWFEFQHFSFDCLFYFTFRFIWILELHARTCVIFFDCLYNHFIYTCSSYRYITTEYCLLTWIIGRKEKQLIL